MEDCADIRMHDFCASPAPALRSSCAQRMNTLYNIEWYNYIRESRGGNSSVPLDVMYCMMAAK